MNLLKIMVRSGLSNESLTIIKSSGKWDYLAKVS